MKWRANALLLWCLGLVLCVVIAVLTTNTALRWGKMGAARPSPALAQAGDSDTDVARSEQPEQDFFVYLPLLVAHSEPYVFLDAWGNEIGMFRFPRGIAVSGEWVYVSDTQNHRIQIFDVHGRPLSAFGTMGSKEGQFQLPYDIAVDGQGNVYVADTDNHRVQKFAADYPTPDPVHGLALNGSFEESPDLVRWAYGGELSVTLVTTATHGLQAARLGAPVPPTERPRGMAWLRQTMYIRLEWERPVLSFRYRMFVNDIIDYSDFHVWLTRTNGAWLAEIMRDGFRSCQGNVAPPAGYDLGWRTASYDLSSFKGQNVRLVFENRNLHNSSWGIWTVVDDVRVVDAGALPDLPGPYRYYFPFAMNAPSCDPVVSALQVEAALRPQRP